MKIRFRPLILATAPLFCAAVGWWVLPWCVSLPPALIKAQCTSVRYTARDGTPLRQLLSSDGNRVAEPLTYELLPARLIHATLAAEDGRFWSHGGVDLLAVARAVKDNLSSARIVSGASTIHQQLIKVTNGKAGPRDFVTKLTEAMQARRLSMSWPRERVLCEYLSRISYGHLLTGCGSAASGYFNKPLHDLTAAECALIAALPQAPSRHDPFRDLEKIRPRQQRILRAMHDRGWLNDEELRVAMAQNITLQRFTGGFAAPHAVEMLRAGGGANQGSIQTTLDSTLQTQVEAIIRSRLAALKDRHVTQAAAVVIENHSGHVLALAGSRDFFAKDGGQINGAWAAHSPGSSVKPFTYQLAFERGATAGSIIADLPIEYGTPTGIYRPENYAHKIYGPMTYRDALGNSLNISAVKVLASVGGAETLLTRLQNLGLTTLNESAEHYGLGLTLGNAPVRLLELTNAYATLARLGECKPWQLVANPQAPIKPQNLRLSPESCYIIADVLSDNAARTHTFGTHSPLRLPFRAAVKTGTSQLYRDNWTLGYTPEFTVGVWVGNFDNTPMQEVSGVTGAAPIWRDIFLHLHERHTMSWFEEPKGIIRALIDPRTGHRLTAQSPPARVSREEIFFQGTLPQQATVQDYDDRGRALLTSDYADWLHSADQWMGDVVALAVQGKHMTWRITSPLPGTVIHLDPDLRGHGRILFLEADVHDTLEWQCSSLSVQRDGEKSFVHLKPGRHSFSARDAVSGVTQSTWVLVRSE